jgi:hypothetical protein
MPTLTIPDAVFERLAKRAAQLNVTVAQLIAPLLDMAAESNDPGHPTTAPTAVRFAEWKNRFDAWMAEVQARVNRYPPGFVMDDSRESIYQDCGE